MNPMRLLKQQHRTIDLQRPMVDGNRLYQVVCACGNKAPAGSRATTEMAQKTHRQEMISLSQNNKDPLSVEEYSGGHSGLLG